MAGLAAYGMAVAHGDTETPLVSTVWTEITQIADVQGPDMSAETIDVTAHDSASSYRETVPSFISSGNVTLELNWDPVAATHVTIRDEFVNRTKSAYRMTFPDSPSTQWYFAAYVTAFSPAGPLDNKLTASVTLSIDGATTFIDPV